MISEQVRQGIRFACIKENTTIAGASRESGVSKSSIYRFMSGKHDIAMLKLDKYCRLGLNRTLKEILELGE